MEAFFPFYLPFNHCYWVAGSVAGALIGQFLPFDTTGIDFAMTALFIVICVNQWRETSCHLPAKTGFFCGMLCLALFGPSGFILPALIAVSACFLYSGIPYKEIWRISHDTFFAKYFLYNHHPFNLCSVHPGNPLVPFLLFGGKRQLPELIRYLGTVLPPAIMAVLIVYCLKGVTPLTWPHGFLS